MRTFYIFLAAVCACFQCTQKGYFMPTETQKVQIFDGDTTMTFQINKAKKEIKIPGDTKVYWYKNNKLFSTKEGYNGPLVHGEYSAMVSGSYLLEMGSFELGLKEGEWLRWHPDGEIRSRYNWKKGKREGPFYIYNPDGTVKQTGKYKDDKMHGDVIIYGQDSGKTKIRYKHGEKVEQTVAPTDNDEQIQKREN